MERLVSLVTVHARCCLPPEAQAAVGDGRRVVPVTLRRDGLTAKTAQKPPLWAMCAPCPLTTLAPIGVHEPPIALRRRDDAGRALLRAAAAHLQTDRDGATQTLARLRMCTAHAEPRPGEAEAAAACMVARGETTCRACHKYSGEPSRLGLPLILEALKQQTCGSGQPPHVCKRPRIAVDAVPMDYEALAKVSTACVMNEMAQGLGRCDGRRVTGLPLSQNHILAHDEPSIRPQRGHIFVHVDHAQECIAAVLC